MQQIKQLELFDFNLPTKADQCFNDLKGKALNIKYYIYLSDISFDTKFIYNRLMKTLEEIDGLLKILAPYSKSFKELTPKALNAITLYDPYPAPLDAISSDDMYYSVDKLLMDCRAIRTRNKAILEEIGMMGEIHYDELLNLLEQVKANLKKKLHGL
jgi:hypothetical protein